LGPVYYLLVRQLAVATSQLHLRDARHAIPAVLLLPLAGHVQLVLALGTISQLIYLTVAVRLLWQYQKVLRSERSDADRLGLLWLLWLLLALAGLVMIDLVRLNLQPYLPFDLRNQWYFLHQLLVFALICLLVLRASRQRDFFGGLDASSTAVGNRASTTDAQAQAVFEHLAALIEQQQLYRQPRLAVADLAKLTALGPKDVSWAMNQGAGISFCDYINQLRLAEVKRKLKQSGRSSILEIAFTAGFNSKSTFNSLFKASTGMTPRQYQRRQVQNPDPGRI
jgi:AraC-like DNA-binding protein